MSKKHQQTDVVIIGNGIAGASLALLLAQKGVRVTIVDKQPLIDMAQPAHRVIAITAENEQFFRKLGIWQALPSTFRAPFRKMKVWDKSGHGEISFDSQSAGVPHLGQIVYNHALLHTLQQALQASTCVTCCQSSVSAINNQAADTVIVALENGQHIGAKLIVGADGARSIVRELLHIPVQRQPYGQLAIVATLKTARPHQATAWQTFSPTGPLAYLPLADPNEVSVVWSQEKTHAEKLLNLPEAEFESAIAAALDNTLGDVSLQTTRFAFPLIRQHADTYIAPRAALLGDAIHTIHPLAGQGLNLGLLDVQALGEILSKAYDKRRDLGHAALLSRYQRARRGDNLKMIHLMEMFHKTFTNSASLVQSGRNLGLQMVDKLPILKTEIMRFAMGLHR